MRELVANLQATNLTNNIQINRESLEVKYHEILWSTINSKTRLNFWYQLAKCTFRRNNVSWNKLHKPCNISLHTLSEMHRYTILASMVIHYRTAHNLLADVRSYKHVCHIVSQKSSNLFAEIFPISLFFLNCSLSG